MVRVGSGVGDWSEKVQDEGEGAGFEHHENLGWSRGAAADGRRRPGRARTQTRPRESPQRAVPGGAGKGWLGVREAGFSQNE